jgi:hypothetical protein
MSIRPLLVILGASFACVSIAQAEEPFYPDLVCSDFLKMDSTAQEKAISWLNGSIAVDDLDTLAALNAVPSSVTVDACKKSPATKVIDVIRHEPRGAV